MSWTELRKKYAISPEEEELFRIISRKRAFWDLDAEIECYENNNYADNNDGKHLDQMTDAQIEAVLDEYMQISEDDFHYIRDNRNMRDAIQRVTGIIP